MPWNISTFCPDFISWTRTIYNGPKACIVNNGCFSKYINIERDAKQGGPTSPYYFLILAEVLAIEIRNNKNIQGLPVGDIMRLFGQFADDMDLYLKATNESLSNALATIQNFGKKSKCYTQENVTWTNEPINVLGVDVTTEMEKLCNINYDKMHDKVEVTLTKWKGRGLSLHGKILVFNSLIASLFMYKMSVLPKIPLKTVKAIEQSLLKFLWNGKRPKI